MEYSPEFLRLNALYKQVRDYRNGENQSISRSKVLEQLILHYPSDWLLPVELYELAAKDNNIELMEAILKHLNSVKQNYPEFGHLIDDGVAIAKQEAVV